MEERVPHPIDACLQSISEASKALRKALRALAASKKALQENRGDIKVMGWEIIDPVQWAGEEWERQIYDLHKPTPEDGGGA